jgi:hypothetical protein
MVVPRTRERGLTVDRFEDGLHRGFGHDDDFTSDDMAALREIVAMTAASGDDDAEDPEPAARRYAGQATSMRAKQANQSGRQF